MKTIATQQILALNDAEASENRIHSDDIALKYGFSGALVSGVNIFGYLIQPLVENYGDQWLSQGMMEVKFIKPAYQDELLSIHTENVAAESGNSPNKRHHLTSAFNEGGELLATLESWLPAKLPTPNALAAETGQNQPGSREEIRWELIHLQKAAPAYLWQPSVADNQVRVNVQRDKSDIYGDEHGFIHPYYLLDACNKALMRLFILPAWIHTGSQLTLRRPIKVGHSIEIHSIPVQKWERKGHQFIKLYVSLWAEGEIALEVDHTAIFKIAS